ncbi:Xaa-Pro peptidase family protein [Mesorhizobium sp. LMG 17147]|uniref:M24 family metallopeptidase n=1 Tax=Mesorhizobium sp. LMG 17147 TaxID=2963091 RepID=UPI0020C9D3F7|nr:Xaa-Pro peptidase family protein [Mesorhizobium sp. LMG 17147]MCP9232827.1 Xaa-Pro peptidase family protein [Mesorhizobium sp. LMG 17147]
MEVVKGPQVFPRSEYLRRLAAVKTKMAERDIAAVVITENAHITYLTGSVAHSYDTRGVLVLASREEPVFVLRWMDVAAAVQETFMERDSIIGYSEEMMANPDKNGYDAVIDFLLDQGLGPSGIGFEMCDLTVDSAQKFKSRLPQARIEDFSNVVTRIRTLKSELEIAVMREAAAISDAGVLRAAEVMRPGLREADAIAEIVGTLARGANGKVGTWIATPFLCATSRIGNPHTTWSEDTLREGSQVNLEIAGVRHDYTAPICRTYSLGKPSDRLLRIHEAQRAGLEAGLNAIRAGAVSGEVAMAIHSTTEKHGFTKRSRAGYAIGIQWTERTTSLKLGDTTVLQPNMTFHMHLGSWVEEDFGYVLSESIRVTDSGVEVLTKAPRELFVLS